MSDKDFMDIAYKNTVRNNNACHDVRAFKAAVLAEFKRLKGDL